jgi:hypothetical protein
MRRSLVAVPAAGLLTLAIAGSALATHCGNASKPDGAGQQVVLLVGLDNSVTTLAGGNSAGKWKGSFADVYIDFDGSGTISSGDLKINDTYLASMHRGVAAPGQDSGDGLAAIAAVLDGDDPAGALRGVGFAQVSFVP